MNRIQGEPTGVSPRTSRIRITPGALRPPARQICAARCRAGSMLVQMLVVISLVTVISMTVITTLASLMRTESRAAATWVNHASFLRLSDDFRSDVQSASTYEIASNDDAEVLTLRAPESGDRQVKYSATSGWVWRTESDGGRVVRSESYRMPDWRIGFELSDGDKPGAFAVGSVVTLHCDRPKAVRSATRTAVPRRVDRVLAVIGRDRRWQKAIDQSDSEEDLSE